MVLIALLKLTFHISVFRGTLGLQILGPRLGGGGGELTETGQVIERTTFGGSGSG